MPPSRPHPLSREIVAFYAPLAATAVMMALTNPLINAGLARLPDPARGLSAYTLAFHLSVLIHSPIFMSQQTALALLDGGISWRRLRRWVLGLGLTLSALEASVAFTPLGDAVFRALYGAPAPVAADAVACLRFLFPLPLLIARRSFSQAVLMTARRTRPITVATATRLATLALGVAAGVGWGVHPGAAVGGAALLLALAAESAVITLAGRASSRDLGGREDLRPPPDLRTALRFFLPLALTVWLWSLTISGVSALVLRGSDPELSLAIWAVVSGAAWLVGSPCLWLQQTALAMATSPRWRRAVRTFSAYVSLGASGLLALLAVPGPRELFLRDLSGLSGRILDAAPGVVLAVAAYPLLLGARAHLQGVLLRAGRTRALLGGSLARLAVIGLLGVPLTLVPGLSGAMLGAIVIQAMIFAETALLGWSASRLA